MGKRWFNKVTGITKGKRKIAKATGIPTTRSGRQAKVGRVVTGRGCSVLIFAVGLGGITGIAWIIS